MIDKSSYGLLKPLLGNDDSDVEHDDDDYVRNTVRSWRWCETQSCSRGSCSRKAVAHR